MDNKERAYHAQMALDNPVMSELLDRLETQAIARALNVSGAEHELRHAACLEARVVRTFRDQLKAFLKSEAVPKASPP